MTPNINMIGNVEPQCEDMVLENEINLSNFSPEDKEDAGDVIQEAAFILGRPLPDTLDPLYRKYFKVRHSDTTYGFGILTENRKEVKGSVGWAVQMALQLEKQVFVFDDKTKQWYRGDRFEAWVLPYNEYKVWVNRFVPCAPPTLDDKSNISLPSSPTLHICNELIQLLERKSSIDRIVEDYKKACDAAITLDHLKEAAHKATQSIQALPAPRTEKVEWYLTLFSGLSTL